MSIERELTKRIDERQNYYLGLASRMGVVALALTTIIMSVYFALTGNIDQAVLIQIPADIGVLVFLAFYIKWKIGNKK